LVTQCQTRQPGKQMGAPKLHEFQALNSPATAVERRRPQRAHGYLSAT